MRTLIDKTAKEKTAQAAGVANGEPPGSYRKTACGQADDRWPEVLVTTYADGEFITSSMTAHEAIAYTGEDVDCQR